MRIISKLSPELLGILTDFSDFFYGRDFSHLESFISLDTKMSKIAVKEMAKDAVSTEYLESALKQPVLSYGFPKHSWGLELSQQRQYIDDAALLKKCEETNDELMSFFGARNNALQMFYPSGGYIGWHTNCNAPGYNIILSCNPEGKGYFKTYDAVTDWHKMYADEKGWNCKVGYFGSDKEPDKMVWHSAYTDTPRVTLSYVIYDENIWRDMVDDIDAG